MENFSSKLLKDAVHELSSLPGIGKKTALRLVLHLLKQEEQEVRRLAESLIKLSEEVVYCKRCHNISDHDICDICSNSRRDKSLICVVQDVRDVMSIENTAQYQGLYHVLGGVLSPIEGIGPEDLNIESLKQRLLGGEVNELIMALPSTMEGDTTNFFIYRQMAKYVDAFSVISRGVAVGDALEYADEITLGRSIRNRQPFSDTMGS